MPCWGGGVSLQPLWSVADHLKRGELVALLSDFEPIQLSIYAVYATRKQMSPLLRSFLDFLVTRLNDNRWSERKTV